ncbi:hypothetical protein [Sutcliffiella rhizosphaerae]|uniref:Glycoamylase-like domain-containing protein n=1 Tax=Sutcliffiella rhizosphaerae TaxID=2880967 RepID=A0ABM8YNR8_9BACI|nr:hypothetical protein [Sutcliffiella rhizosphaerae]CAG9621627.1 hypothetical protein BACCIP111883_02400 [Sutcliffiella rhizosphaerae]
MSNQYYEALPSNVKKFFDRQFYDSYALFEASRHPYTGLYADGYMTLGENPDFRSSIAATGVGLISLAIAEKENWDGKAAEKALITLKAVSGEIEGCKVARDEKSGFFAHFVDMETGENLNSEYSTIDTTLLITGALLAGNQFKNKEPRILHMAEQLLYSINWSIVVADKDKGVINMISKDGEGIAPLPAFNEYVMVSYLAMLGKPDDHNVQALWHNNFAEDKINKLSQEDFRGLPLLNDYPGAFLSSFVHQFPFYLVPEYAESKTYLEYFRNACLADRLKWRELDDVPSYIWGYGAGPNDGLFDGYHADKINNAPHNIASSYIIGGYLPVYPAGIYDLYAQYSLHIPYDVYENPNDKEEEEKFRAAYKFGLHRISWWHLEQPKRWYPTKVTLIDWSSMLYGLTAFKHGMSFFSDNLPKISTSHKN